MSDSWHQNIKNKNREEIIAAAKKLFLEYNFLNVNIKDVCELAGISRVTFYKNFKSLDELIFEVQMSILIHMDSFIRDSDDNGISGIERIRKMLYAWVEFAKKYKDEMKYIILFDLYFEAYDSNSELKTRFESFIRVDSSNASFSSAISAGIEDGSLKRELHPIKTGYFIYQTVMGLLERMSSSKIPVNSEVIVTYDDIVIPVIEMIISSIKGDN